MLAKYDNLGINQKQFLAGACAGFTYTNIAFVFDLLKVRAQHDKTKKMNYSNEIARIYKHEGMRGFMKGY